MSSALMYFIFTGSNITFSGSTIAFPGMPSNLSIPSGAIQIPSIGPTVNQPTSTPAPEIQTRRPGYTYTPGIGAHKLYTQRTDWNTARRTCDQDGGYLTIINSDAEAQAIVRLLNESNSESSHVGVHDLYEEGDFVTIHGDPLSRTGFDVWRNGEPNDYGGVEDCVAIFKDGKLNDVRCNLRTGFICEHSETSPAPELLTNIPEAN